eukprot:TRINITY_DN15251_c0_g3_i1.p1 TRINITY_DN15251_c0_g3~~TRINITY_DN15251_c0_g3_i1.p1  ORF type:complete len:176 (-),score=52.27 TRINITY_DN15251_c0_g3_i1:428-955(-)
MSDRHNNKDKRSKDVVDDLSVWGRYRRIDPSVIALIRSRDIPYCMLHLLTEEELNFIPSSIERKKIIAYAKHDAGVEKLHTLPPDIRYYNDSDDDDNNNTAQHTPPSTPLAHRRPSSASSSSSGSGSASGSRRRSSSSSSNTGNQKNDNKGRTAKKASPAATSSSSTSYLTSKKR